VAPLPGLHAETLADAEEQLVLVCHRLAGTRVPTEVAFAGGALRAWMWTHLGLVSSKDAIGNPHCISSALLETPIAFQGPY
jgi:hypothetical protein